MIPVIALLNLFNSAISLLIAIRVFVAWRKNKSYAMTSFLLFYVCFALLWFFWGMPGVFVHSGEVAALANLIGFLTLFASMIAIIQVATSFLDRPTWGAMLGILVATGGLIFLIARVTNLTPSILQTGQQYIYWSGTLPDWLRVFVGVIAFSAALFCTSVFAYLAWREKNNPAIYRRSEYLTAGMSALILASTSSFFLYPLFGLFVANGLASLLDIIGLLLMLAGILPGKPLVKDYQSPDTVIQPS